MKKRNPDNQIEEYIKSKAEEEFKKLLEGKKVVDNFTVLLFGISRLFYRLEELQDTTENPIWISIVAGIITYIIINVFH